MRVRAGEYEGWGECEASPLVSIASLICPMSHSACKPVAHSVWGSESIVPTISIASAILCEPTVSIFCKPTIRCRNRHRAVGFARATIGTACLETAGILDILPQDSVRFGAVWKHCQETLNKARSIRSRGFVAAKFGWGPFGTLGIEEDNAQLLAAREGLGADGILLIDAGTVWNTNLEAARARVDVLQCVQATWLEEPFVSGALAEYNALSIASEPVKLAGGEGCHTYHMAQHMIDHAGLGYVQIDAGRIGGISVAKAVADYADAQGVTYVNHTFTSNLALSASLQPFAGLAKHGIAEYPTELSRWRST